MGACSFRQESPVCTFANQLKLDRELMLKGTGWTGNTGFRGPWNLLPSLVPTVTEFFMQVLSFLAISAPTDNNIPLPFKDNDLMVIILYHLINHFS